jgi:hypothetical protein
LDFNKDVVPFSVSVGSLFAQPFPTMAIKNRRAIDKMMGLQYYPLIGEETAQNQSSSAATNTSSSSLSSSLADQSSGAEEYSFSFSYTEVISNSSVPSSSARRYRNLDETEDTESQ